MKVWIPSKFRQRGYIGGGVQQHNHTSSTSGGTLGNNTVDLAQLVDAAVSAAKLADAATLKKLDSGSASNVATLDIVFTPYSAMRGFLILLPLIKPANDGANLWMRVSSDGGASYLADANYVHASYRLAVVSTPAVNSTTPGTFADSRYVLGTGLGSLAVRGGSFAVWMYDNFEAANCPHINWHGSYLDNSGTFQGIGVHGHGVRGVNAVNDAVRFLFSVGNIATIKWSLFGWN